MTRYRRTQVGWAIVVSMLIPAAILTTVAVTGQTVIPLLALIPLLVIFPLFGWLTVDVTDDTVGLRFGVGAIHKRVRLDEIDSITPLNNAWLCGWGIRLIPGGWLYNVSGTQAVELRLRNGRRVRIGTDDQDGLIAALRDARATVALSMTPETSTSPMLGYTHGAVLACVAIVMAGTVLVLTMGTRPLTVVASSADVSISGSGYSTRIAAADIVAVHLDEQLPAVRWRTNGASFGGRMRGHFKLSDGRAAQLFVTRSHPPFLTVETRTEPVIVNFDEPDRTRALYEQLSASF